MAKETLLEYKSSKWMTPEGRTNTSCLVYDPFLVEVIVENALRKQSITNIVKVDIYKDVTLGLDEKMKEETHILTVPPLETKSLSVNFTPTQEAAYYYVIHIEGKMVNSKLYQHRGIYAHRKETILILDEPPSNVQARSTVSFTGRLLSTNTGEGIDGAKIHIHHSDIEKNKFMASGTTKSDGAFSIEWIAQKMDLLHYAGEAYAKFEGDDFYKPSRSSRFTISVIHTPQKSTSKAKLHQKFEGISNLLL